MAELDRAAARARCEKATPGPWTEYRNGVWATDSKSWIVPESAWRKQSDAEFIAHARTDLPAALAALDLAGEVVTRLEAENQRLREALQKTELAIEPLMDRDLVTPFVSAWEFDRHGFRGDGEWCYEQLLAAYDSVRAALGSPVDGEDQ